MVFSDKTNRDYIALAKYWAEIKSKDPSSKVGAVIVRPNNTIVSMGYNGFPRGMDDSPDLYEDRETKYGRIVHAEMNAIMTAYEPLTGYTLYLWPFLPCPPCALHVIQTGIAKVIAPECPPDKLDRWNYLLMKSKSMFKEVGVEFMELKYDYR